MQLGKSLSRNCTCHTIGSARKEEHFDGIPNWGGMGDWKGNGKGLEREWEFLRDGDWEGEGEFSSQRDPRNDPVFVFHHTLARWRLADITMWLGLN